MLKSKKVKKIIVNGLTTSRIVGAFALPVVFSFSSIPLIIGVLSGLFLTDFLDGKLSRKWGVQTVGGSLLDPLGDKTLAIACILSFVGAQNFLLMPLFMEFGITAVNVNRTLHEENVKSSIIGKIKTWVLSAMLVLCAVNALNPDLANIIAQKITEKAHLDLPNIMDLTVTSEVVKNASAVTLGMQALTLGDYISQSVINREKRSKKIAELKSLREIMIRLFDETKYEEDKDKPLINILKK